MKLGLALAAGVTRAFLGLIGAFGVEAASGPVGESARGEDVFFST